MKTYFLSTNTGLAIVLACVGFFLNTNRACAQQKYNHLSIEVSVGATAPISPITVSRSEHISVPQLRVGARYMFNKNWGLRSLYNHDDFGDQTKGLSIDRLGLEGVANLGNLLQLPYRWREHIGLLAHSGIGAGTERPRQGDAVSYVGNFFIGASLQVKLSNRFALVGDLSYTTTFRQSYGYDGTLLNAATDGSMVSVQLGVHFYLGSKNYHADWY